MFYSIALNLITLAVASAATGTTTSAPAFTGSPSNGVPCSVANGTYCLDSNGSSDIIFLCKNGALEALNCNDVTGGNQTKIPSCVSVNANSASCSPNPLTTIPGAQTLPSPDTSTSVAQSVSTTASTTASLTSSSASASTSASTSTLTSTSTQSQSSSTTTSLSSTVSTGGASGILGSSTLATLVGFLAVLGL